MVGGKEGRGRWEGRKGEVGGGKGEGDGREEGREGGITLFSLVVGWVTSYHGDAVVM